MINVNKPSEGLDYVIKPIPEITNDQAWLVEVKTGPYKGYQLVFTRIEYNGKTGTIRFQLDTLSEEEVEITTELEDFAFEILQDVIKTGLANGSVVLNDKDSNN